MGNAEKDVVVSNASCTTNGMASVCKVLDDNFDVQYGLMTTTHSYTGDQMILESRHLDLLRARAGACNIVPTSTGAAKAVAAVLPKYKGKLNGIALRVPTPNVSIVDLVVKVGKKCTKEDVNAAVKAAADGKMKGIINFEEQPLLQQKCQWQPRPAACGASEVFLHFWSTLRCRSCEIDTITNLRHRLLT